MPEIKNNPWSELTTVKKATVQVNGVDVEVEIDVPIQVKTVFDPSGIQASYGKETNKDGDIEMHIVIPAQQKIKNALDICGAEVIGDRLNEFIESRGKDNLWDELTVHDIGAIYNNVSGKWLTDDELQEFCEWAEGRV